MGIIYALMFIAAIVFILRHNPKVEMSPVVTARDKADVEKRYKWLRKASFFTVPLFVILAFGFNDTSTSKAEVHLWVLAAVIPMIFHIDLLKSEQTDSLFVYRHAQQARALVVLRAGTAAFSLSMGEYAIFAFLIINGFLWLVGGSLCFRQLKKDTCWLMRIKGEKPVLALNFDVRLAQSSLEEGITLSKNDGNKKDAIENLLLAFQHGTPEIRQRAVETLDKLGEVEKF